MGIRVLFVRLLPLLDDPVVMRQAQVWLVAIAASIATSVAVGLASGDWHAGSFGLAAAMLHPQGFYGDSWEPMTRTLMHLINEPDQPVYQKVFFGEGAKFQYPLMSLLPLDLLLRLGIDPAASGFLVLNLISWAAFFAIGITSALLWARAQRPVGVPMREVVPLRGYLVLVPAGLVSASLFYGITRGVWLGQAQTVLTLFAVVAIWAWQTERRWLAGILLALCCMVKPQWAVVAVWALVRRQWSVVAWGGGTAVLLTVIALVHYGPEQLFGYIEVLRALGPGSAFYPNQSVNGVLNRMLGTGDVFVWDHSEIAQPHPVVAVATWAATAVFLVAAVLWRAKSRPTALDLSLVLLSLTLASPIAWEHHYGLVLGIFAVLLPVAIRRSSLGRWTPVVLVVSYVLLSQNLWTALQPLDGTPGSILISYMFAGGLILLATLYITTARQGDDDADSWDLALSGRESAR